MYFDAIEALKEKYDDLFNVYHTFSRARENDCLFGRIEKSTVNYVLRNRHKDLKPYKYYLCGPLPMIESVSAALAENGVSGADIAHELFTEPDNDPQASPVTEGQTHLEVTLDDAVYTLEMDRKTIVLDAVLKAKIDAPYSCQGGVCSTCIARVTEGRATMAKNQILTDSELADGFILTCQAHAETAILKIDYDDV